MNSESESSSQSDDESNDNNSCSLCAKSFSSKIALQIHVQIVHTDIKIEIEDEDARPLTPLDLVPYAEHSCDACSEMFETESELQIHIDEVHLNCHISRPPNTASSATKKNCTLCSNFFFSNYNLRKHIQNVHPNVDVDKICPRKQIRRPVDNLSKLPCTMCPKMFLTKGSLQRHYCEMHGLVNFLRRKRNRRVGGPPPGPVFPCSLCKKSLGRAYYLRKHVIEDHPEADVDELCPLKQKRRHNIEPVHSCEACDKSFLSRGALQRHTKKIHGYALDPVKKRPRSSLKSVLCPECHELFQNKFHLRRHIYAKHPDFVYNDICTRKKVRPLDHTVRSCSACDKHFVSRFGLWRHTRVVHGCTPDILVKRKSQVKQKSHFATSDSKSPQDSSKFLCSFCSKGFAYKQSLRKHFQLVHTEVTDSKDTVGAKKIEKTSTIICPGKFEIRRVYRGRCTQSIGFYIIFLTLPHEGMFATFKALITCLESFLVLIVVI